MLPVVHIQFTGYGVRWNHRQTTKPFIWTATAEDILAKVARERVALKQVNQ
jgi:hypothetical protein